MADTLGTWKVENDHKVYLKPPYKLVFIRLPESEGDTQDIYEILIHKNDKEVMKMGFRKEHSGGRSEYLLLEISPEKYTFTVKNYGGVEQDNDILAVHSIENFERFEKKVLASLSLEEYLNVRGRALQRLQTMFDQVEAPYVSFTTPYFLMLKFWPKNTRNGYCIYVAYDYKNDRVNLLTTRESMEEFLTRNRIELNNGSNEALLQEKNKDLLVSFLIRCSENQFKWVVSNVEGVLDISFVNDQNKEEIRARLNPIEKKLVEPTLKKESLRLVFLYTWFPGAIHEWNITEKEGKIRIEETTMLEDVYLPSFMTADPESLEKTGHYR